MRRVAATTAEVDELELSSEPEESAGAGDLRTLLLLLGCSFLTIVKSTWNTFYQQTNKYFFV